VLCRAVEDVQRPATPAQVASALVSVTSRAVEAAGRPARLAVVSAADPVDRSTGRLMHLPDAPFLLGELSPREALAGLVRGPVTVDNDVNWAARAEYASSRASRLDDFVYLHLGQGLGCAVVSDGQVRRGHSGLAGEIAHLLTAGPSGAVPFTAIFADLDLRRPGSTAIDDETLLRILDQGGPHAEDVTRTVATAVCGVLIAVIALCDPQEVLVGGTWGLHPAVLQAVDIELQRLPRRVRVRAAQLTDEPSLVGARHQALHDLRAAIAHTSAATQGGTEATRSRLGSGALAHRHAAQAEGRGDGCLPAGEGYP
jgi:predicted NBD/HSP70 family sugar kinase